MQISNASVPFPNAVAPFNPKVDQPSSGVTKDILVSSFAPLSESQSLSSSQNSLSENVVVYSPQSLVQTASSNIPVAPSNTPSAPNSEVSPSSIDAIPGRPSSESDQGAADAGNVVVQPSERESEDGVQAVGGVNTNENEPVDDGSAPEPSKESASSQSPSSVGLTPDEQVIVSELAARDREVRTHEQQHQSVGGPFAGAASFSYQTGPDGVQYAVGGEVSIDLSAVPNNPQATIDKMRTVQSAALAPAEPSAQDRSVASSASRIMLQAQAELAAQRAEELQMNRAEIQQRQAESTAAREEQQDRQERRRAEISDSVRTYESLVELGQKYENGLTPVIKLDEVV